MANNYDKYSNYDFSKFEPKPSSYERNAARKIVELPPFEQPEQEARMKLVKRKKKSVAQAKAEMRAASLRSFKVIAVAVFLLSMFAALLYSKLRVDELDRQINRTQTGLTAAQSENVKLNMQLDSMISLEKVEDYAQNTLGMVKVENYQITYLDLSGQDAVHVSGGKRAGVQGEEETALTKLLEYIRA